LQLGPNRIFAPNFIANIIGKTIFFLVPERDDQVQ
jgi:hypothetical protein